MRYGLNCCALNSADACISALALLSGTLDEFLWMLAKMTGKDDWLHE